MHARQIEKGFSILTWSQRDYEPIFRIWISEEGDNDRQVTSLWRFYVPDAQHQESRLYRRLCERTGLSFQADVSHVRPSRQTLGQYTVALDPIFE